MELTARLYRCKRCGAQPERQDKPVAKMPSGFVARFLACGHSIPATDRPVSEAK